MSQQCNHTNLEDVENHVKVEVSSAENKMASVSLSELDRALEAKESAPLCEEVFLCTICVEIDIPVLDRVLIPDCNHSFCLDCLLSWANVRVVCPNCKAPFSSLLIHRSQEGNLLPGPWTRSLEPPWRLEHVTLLQQLSWVQLREVHTPQYDIENSFSLPPLSIESTQSQQPGQSSSAAPYYLHEEVEDELEERFWQEEEQQYDRLMRRTRVISNRRFGPKGYIASGHMQAKARPPPCRTKGGDSSGAGSSDAHRSNRKSGTPRSQIGSGGGGRKKKVKKKSRAGIAAAAAAKGNIEARLPQPSAASPSVSSAVGTVSTTTNPSMPGTHASNENE